MSIQSNIFLIAVLFATIGCGMRKDIKELKKQNSEQDRRLNDHESRILELENLIQNNIASINSVESETSNLAFLIEELQANDTTTEEQINQIQLMVNNNNSLISTLQSQHTLLSLQLANLSNLTTSSVTGYVDPCGDGIGFDEILLKTGDGTYIAYFESNGKRHLSVLTRNTSYRTTDQQQCNFTINNLGQLTY